MNMKWLAVGLICLTAGAVALTPQLQRPAQVVDPVQLPAQQAEIEVVFVLDTTGSMGGLIAAAKEKIWSIASTMASAEPAPRIRMGLVAYRDRGDDYVTRLTPLSSDIDQMYATLMDLQAHGGGDTPESVAAGLSRAVHDAGWSQRDGVYRVVFLVGDAPPQHYQDETSYEAVVRAAAARGIVVNAIRCGGSAETERVWRQIAGLAQGEFFSVGQAGDAIAIATPFDAKMAALSAKLDATRLSYGDRNVHEAAAAKAAATDKLNDAGSTTALARRAAFNASSAGRANAFGDHDLLSALEAGKVRLEDIAPEALPEPLRSLEPPAQQDFVERQQEERRQIAGELAELAEQRDAYLAEQAGALEDKEESLDYKLGATIMRQAKEKGMTYEAQAAPKL